MKSKLFAFVGGLTFCSGVAFAGISERLNKHGEITVQPFGMNRFPYNSYGVGGSYYLYPNLFLGAEYTSGSSTLKGITSKNTTIGLRAKYFLTDSFYLGSGLTNYTFALNGEQEFKNSSDVVVTKSDLDIEVKGNTFDFFIGNQWNLYDYLTLGCDWVGISLPVGASSSDNLPNSAKDTDEYKDNKTLIDWMENKPTVMLTRFYVGIVF